MAAITQSKIVAIHPIKAIKIETIYVNNKKSPARLCVGDVFLFLRHKAMATFVLWGMISPSLIFIFCLQLHVCGLKPHRVRHGACSFLLR